MITVQYSQVTLTIKYHYGIHKDKFKYRSTCFDYPSRDIPVSVKD